MRKLLLTLSLSVSCLNSIAQKIEVSIQANTGLFHYTGISAQNNSVFIEAADHSSNYTNNPYGKYYSNNYDAGFKINWNIKHHFILGLQTDLQVAKSRVAINGFYPYRNPFYHYTSFSQFDATGNTYLTSKFVNISPYVGYRLYVKQLQVDVMPGMDIGIGLISYEHGTADVNGIEQPYTSKRQRHKPPTDIRLRLGTSISYKRYAVNASYAKGFSNYMDGVVGGGPYKVNSELLRIGVGYKVF